MNHLRTTHRKKRMPYLGIARLGNLFRDELPSSNALGICQHGLLNSFDKGKVPVVTGTF